MHTPYDSDLGKSTVYPKAYDPFLLFAIPRSLGRKELGLTDKSRPFTGHDVWNAWEVSWLNLRGRPCVAVGTIEVPAESPFLIESKSLKLYLNSLNSSRYVGREEVEALISRDLSEKAGASVSCTLRELKDFPHSIQSYQGTHLDALDIEVDGFHYEPDLLRQDEEAGVVTETVYSDLLKSNCPVTSQPDWGSVRISYTGKKLNHESLLRYILSFREHNEFHEQCAERIFMEILKKSAATRLVVECHYTRRGGLDINPWRSLPHCEAPEYSRLVRQ